MQRGEARLVQNLAGGGYKGLQTPKNSLVT